MQSDAVEYGKPDRLVAVHWSDDRAFESFKESVKNKT